jgi:hypothetical protein
MAAAAVAGVRSGIVPSRFFVLSPPKRYKKPGSDQGAAPASWQQPHPSGVTGAPDPKVESRGLSQ